MNSFNGLSLATEDVINNVAIILCAAEVLASTQPYLGLGRELLSIASEYSSKAQKDNEQQHVTSSRDSTALSLSERIQITRENLGLSEADLARQLNTYSDHISDWECGITEPPASMITPLANALKCDPLWLLSGEASIHQASAGGVGQQHRHVSQPTGAESHEVLQR